MARMQSIMTLMRLRNGSDKSAFLVGVAAFMP